MAAASRPMAPYARKEEEGWEEKGGCGGGDSYARIEGKERRGGSLVPPLLNAPEMGEPRGGGEDDSLVISE